MRFYTIPHRFYCGSDLHVDWRYLCVIDANGEVRRHQNIRADPQAFLLAVHPFREDLVVWAACMLTW
jgi:transposase